MFHFCPSTGLPPSSTPTLFYDRTPIPSSLSPQIPLSQGRDSDPPPTPPTLLKDGLGNLSYSKGFIETVFFFFHIQVGGKRDGAYKQEPEGGTKGTR